MVSVFFDTFYTMGRRGTRRKLRRSHRGGASLAKSLALVLLAGIGQHTVQVEAGVLDKVKEGWKWLNTKHDPEEMNRVATQIVELAKKGSALKPPGVVDALGGIDEINNKLKRLNDRLAGTSPTAAPSPDPLKRPVGSLIPANVYITDDGTVFEYENAYNRPTGFEVHGRDPNTRAQVILTYENPETKVTLVSNPYAPAYDLDGEWVPSGEGTEENIWTWSGGSRRRKRRYRRKTLRRKK